MTKGPSADDRGSRDELERWLCAVEGAAAEIVEVGDKLFSHGAPSDQTCWVDIGSTSG
jgi:hypothetical protein